MLSSVTAAANASLFDDSTGVCFASGGATCSHDADFYLRIRRIKEEPRLLMMYRNAALNTEGRAGSRLTDTSLLENMDAYCKDVVQYESHSAKIVGC